MIDSTADLIPVLEGLSYEDFHAVAMFTEYLSAQSNAREREMDPFYSEKNMSYLAGVIDDIESGRSIPKERELIEEVD